MAAGARAGGRDGMPVVPPELQPISSSAAPPVGGPVPDGPVGPLGLLPSLSPTAPRHPRRRGGGPIRVLTIAGVLAAAIGALWALATVLGPFAALHPNPAPPGPASCPSGQASPPAAVSVQTFGPSGTYPNGTRIEVAYEVELLPAAGTPSTATVSVPSLTALFPVAGGPSLAVVLPPRNLGVVSSGWTNSSPVAHNRTVSGTVSFAPNGTASISSSLLAITAPLPYGSVEVAFRWNWTIAPPSGPSKSSGWTVPTASGPVPSVFPPAGAVSAGVMDPSNTTIGENLTVSISGAASGERLRLVLENATTGLNLNRQNVTAPSTAGSPFAAEIPLLGASGRLVPGHYLIHLHDACGALVLSAGVTAVYAASATVGIAVSPSTCGPISFGGSAYANASQWTGVPSSAGRPLSAASSCGSLAFAGWTAAGGVYIPASNSSATTAIVSASGTLRASYV